MKILNKIKNEIFLYTIIEITGIKVLESFG